MSDDVHSVFIFDSEIIAKRKDRKKHSNYISRCVDGIVDFFVCHRSCSYSVLDVNLSNIMAPSYSVVKLNLSFEDERNQSLCVHPDVVKLNLSFEYST